MRKLSYFLQYIVVRVILGILAPLPFCLRGKFAAKIGKAAFWILPSARRRILRHLTKVYPNRPARELTRLGRQVAGNTARSLSELLDNHRFSKVAKNLPASGPGLAAIESAQAAGRAVIILSGHFGQWEAIRHVLKHRGVETGALYRTNNNPYYEPFFVRNIEYGGKPLVPKGAGGVRKMLAVLKKGGAMAILADQHFGDGANIAFLGHPAKTTLSPAEMALRYNAVLVPAFATRHKTGIEVQFEEPILHSDAVTMMTIFNERIERRIRSNPEQWHWAHKRWKGD